MRTVSDTIERLRSGSATLTFHEARFILKRTAHLLAELAKDGAPSRGVRAAVRVLTLSPQRIA